MEGNSSTIGNRIKEARDQLGLTQEKLAEKIYIDKSTMCNIENGKRKNIDRSLINEIAKVLNVTPEYILGIDPLPTDEDHFIQYILAHFKITTTNKNNKQVYKNESDLLLSQNEDYIVLSASKRFFSAIREILQAEQLKEELSEDEYSHRIKKARMLLRFNVNDPSNKYDCFLISVEQLNQMQKEEGKRKELQAELENLLKEANET